MSIHKIAIPLPCWQDRSIKFDTKPIKHLKLRAGEKVLATIDDIDDGTGGKGIGQLQLTNLRFLWFNSGLDTVNLSIGMNCVSNIEIDEEQPNMKMLKVFAAHQWDFCFNFILYDTSSTTPDIFKKAITVLQRYTGTKLFREVKMSCPEITVDDERNQQNGGLSLLSSKERILKIIPGIWNLKKKKTTKTEKSSEDEKEKEPENDINNDEEEDEQEEEEEKRLGTLILTNVRFVWIADHIQNSSNEKNKDEEEKDVPSTASVTNLSIPWVHIEIIGIRGNKQQLAEKQRRQLEIVTDKENQRKQQQQQQQQKIQEEEKTEENSEEQQQAEAEEAEERAASKTTREVETKSVNVISNNNDNNNNEDTFLSVFKVTTSGLAGSYNLGFQLPKSFFDERQQKMLITKEQQQQQQKKDDTSTTLPTTATSTTSMEEVLFDFVEELRDYHEDCFHHAEYGVEFSDLI